MKNCNLILIFAFFCNYINAQLPYADVPGLVARSFEETNLYNYRNAIDKTGKKYLTDVPVMTIEGVSRSNIGRPVVALQLSNYSDICDCYRLNLAKKKSCQKERDFLFKAYRFAEKLYKSSSSIKTENGTVIQIQEQYSDIVNDIEHALLKIKKKSNEWCF